MSKKTHISGLCRLSPLLLAGLISTSAQAQLHSHILDEGDFLTEIPQVSSVTGMVQRTQDTPASVTVVDRATIEASGAQTLPDLLRLVPGFQVFHVNANKFGATYHGMSDEFPNQLEVMVDGRSVYLPLLSTVAWTTLGLHPNDIERIEVVRGSNTATHGSNAFMGAVNFITRHPASEPKFTAQLGGGSRNAALGQLRVSGEGQGLYYRVSAAQEENAGSKRFNDDARRRYLNSTLVFTPSLYDQLELRLGVDQGHTRIGYLEPTNGFDPDARYISRQNYRADYQQINWSRLLDAESTLHFRLYRNYLKLDEQKPSMEAVRDFYLYPRTPQGMSPSDRFDLAEQTAIDFLAANPDFRGYREHGRTQVIDSELALQHRHGALHNYLGAGIRYSEASSPVLLQQGEITSHRYRLFNTSSYTFHPQWVANLGLMYEKQASANDAFSWRSGLNYELSAANTLRVGYSQSERLPSILERNGNYRISTLEILGSDMHIDTGNPNLEPERINSVELGWMHEFEHLPGYLDTRLFHERIRKAVVNYKTGPNADDPGTKMNNGEWRNRGFETQLKLQPHNQWWLLLNYAYIDNQASNWDQGDRGTFPGGQISPRHTLSALINWQPVEALNLSAAHYYMSKADWRQSYGTMQEFSPPAYHRTDLRAAKHWLLNGTEAELSLVVQNAFNNRYQEFYLDNQFERRYFLELSVSFD